MRMDPMRGLALVCVIAACGDDDATMEAGDREIFGALEAPVVVDPGTAANLSLRDGPRVPDARELPALSREDAPPLPPALPEGPLRVLSWAPTGADDLVGAIRVTFSHPMVPLEALSALAEERAPMTVEPAPEGRFRWLGTTTLAFEPRGRMPKATRYTVTIPAGTTSVSGATLERAHTFSFETPPPSIESTFPPDEATMILGDTLVGVLFDQRIDAGRVAAAARLDGARGVTLMGLTGEDLATAKERNAALQSWPDDRSIVFRPSAPLAAATTYTIRIPRGTTGSEGPLPTTGDLTSRFHTIEPLRVTEVDCAREACEPRQYVSVGFNAQLRRQDLAGLVTVEPPVAGFHASVAFASISIEGDFAAATTYTLTVAPGITDVFDQRLARAETHRIRFGNAEPDASLGLGWIAILERDAPRTVPVTLTNVPRVTARVAPVPRDKIAQALRGATDGRGYGEGEPDPFVRAGLVPVTVEARTEVARNREERVGLSLGDTIPAGRPGMALVEVDLTPPGEEYRYYGFSLVVATDLGVVSTTDAFGTVVRVTSLSSGAPVAGARVELRGLPYSRGGAVPPVLAATSDAEGIARLGTSTIDARRYLVVQKEGDVALAEFNRIYPRSEELAGCVYTDRDPYRPGDTVHLRVVARRRQAHPAAELEPVAGEWLKCTIRPAEGGAVPFEGRLSPYGTFTHDLALDRNAPIGRWGVQCHVHRRGGTEIYGAFEVQEYRAPEISVTVRAPEGVRFVRQRPTVEIASSYLFGAAAAGLPVRYTVGREPTVFRPPGHDGFEFGIESGWRTIGGGYDDGRHSTIGRSHAQREIVARGEGTLSDAGSLEVPVELDPGQEEGPVNFVVEAAVTDASRQEVAGRAEIVAHPASLYVGMRLASPFIGHEDPIRPSLVVSAIDGAARAGKPIVVRALEQRTSLVAEPTRDGGFDYRWVTEEREVGRCTATSAPAPVDCRIAPQRPGRVVLEATTQDERGRTAKTTSTIWITGPGWVPSEAEALELLPGSSEVAPGQTTRILVRAPFPRGRGLVTIERLGVVESRAIDLEGSLATIDVPITEQLVPKVTVRVALARGRASREDLAELLRSSGADAARAAEQDLGRPAFATASVDLTISDASKRLSVTVRPDQPVRAPGEPLAVDVQVRDPQGAAVDAEVAVMVVDEGVLSLLGFETPDPVDALFPSEPSANYAQTAQSSANHLLVVRQRPARTIGAPEAAAALEELMGQSIGSNFGFGGLGLRGTGRGGGGTGEGTIGLGNLGTIGHGGGGGSGSGYGRGAGGGADERTRPRTRGDRAIPTETRALFATTAFYAGAVRTDREGNARVNVEMPSNLTTFRIMAIAVGRDDRSGSGDATVEVRKPLLLRPAVPRFATLGDRFDAQVIVHNETGAETDVTVAVRAAGLAIDGEASQELHLARGEARRVAFPVRVEAGRGTAQIQFAASARGAADAVQATLPIIEPATAEAFSTYGSIESGAVRIPVNVPEGAHAAFGGLEVTLGTTALTDVEQAAEWLVEYPYECAEQIGAKLIATVALLAVLDPESAEAVRLRGLADEWVAKVFRLRSGEGFALWPGMESDLYTTAWVALALDRARDAGIAVDEGGFDDIVRYLGGSVRWFPESRYPWTAHVLALYAVAEAGALDRVYERTEAIADLFAQRADRPLYARAWLAAAIGAARADDPRAAEILREIENAAVESAGTASFAERRVETTVPGTNEERLLWHSARRTDAIVLGTLLRRAPGSPLVEKTVRGLLAARRNGRWGSTQENAWILDALGRYARAREATPPSLTANTWLGERFLVATEFEGRSSRLFEGVVSMADLVETGNTTIVVGETGTGRLYYRIGLRYAPRELRLPPAEAGFSVTRSYEAIGDPAAVTRDARGAWRIRAGTDVRVRLTLVVPTDRYDVALDDPLPAGLEPVNMMFRTSATQRLSAELIERIHDAGDFWSIFAFDHRELRDERVTAFARYASAGVYELVYAARATTPGTYLAQPSHAEEMYAPETFGRSATDTVIVDAESTTDAAD